MIRAILTDIEGTTTSVSFVFDVLFPYFTNHMDELLPMLNENEEVQQCFQNIAGKANIPNEPQAILNQLRQWVQEDLKEENLKKLQGIVWKKAYETGAVKGHVYSDVPEALRKWKNLGITLGIYSSGSVPAQKLLFSHSEFGDLSPLFSAFFDTRVGGKREKESYSIIADEMNLTPSTILFLSDVEAELDAACRAGMKVLQLVRPGTPASANHPHVQHFGEIYPANFD